MLCVCIEVVYVCNFMCYVQHVELKLFCWGIALLKTIYYYYYYYYYNTSVCLFVALLKANITKKCTLSCRVQIKKAFIFKPFAGLDFFSKVLAVFFIFPFFLSFQAGYGKAGTACSRGPSDKKQKSLKTRGVRVHGPPEFC